MHIVVLGAMGCGKTTLGRELAERSGRPLLDNDERLLAAQGRSAREIGATEGLTRLHQLELDVLDADLRRPQPSVITAAASTVRSIDRVRLGDHFVVFLDCDPEVARRRRASGAHRPALELMEAERLLRVQRATNVADLVVDSGATTPAELAGVVLGALPSA